MGVILDEPKYRVTDEAPSLSTIVGNFTLAEAAAAPGLAALSYPFGTQVAPRLVQRASGCTAAFLGGLAGFCFAYQRSAGKLMGFLDPGPPSQR